MFAQRELRKIEESLLEGEGILLHLDGADIQVQMLSGSKLRFSTPVYRGGNYIPHSVREALKKKHVFHTAMSTSFQVDEAHFMVWIHYLGLSDGLSVTKIQGLVQEFGEIASQWRCHLDEQDRNDLVRVPS